MARQLQDRTEEGCSSKDRELQVSNESRTIKAIVLAYTRTVNELGASTEDIEMNLMPEFTKRAIKQAVLDLLRSGELQLSKGGRIHVVNDTV